MKHPVYLEVTCAAVRAKLVNMTLKVINDRNVSMLIHTQTTPPAPTTHISPQPPTTQTHKDKIYRECIHVLDPKHLIPIVLNFTGAGIQTVLVYEPVQQNVLHLFKRVQKRKKEKRAIKKYKRIERTVNNTVSCLPLNDMTSKRNKRKYTGHDITILACYINIRLA